MLISLNWNKQGPVQDADGKCSVWQQLQQHPVISIQRVSHTPQRNIQPTISIGTYMVCQGFWTVNLVIQLS